MNALQPEIDKINEGAAGPAGRGESGRSGLTFGCGGLDVADERRDAEGDRQPVRRSQEGRAAAGDREVHLALTERRP